MKILIKFGVAAFVSCCLLSCQEELEISSDNVYNYTEPESVEITDSIIVNPFELERLISHHLNEHNIKSSNSRGNHNELIKTRAGYDGLYIVNFGESNGWMIASASKNFTPILAYSSEGSFNFDNMPPAAKEWLEDMLHAIELSSDFPVDYKSEMHDLWKIYENGTLNTGCSRGPQYEPINPYDYDILQKQFMDSLTVWNSKYYQVFQLNDNLYRKYPEIYNEFDELARVSTWPEYENAYKDVTFVVIREEGASTGTGNLIHTQWNQENKGFNNTFPVLTTTDGKKFKAIAGCGPVAMGQVMHYYQYPLTFDWNNMPLSYGTDTTSDFLYQIALKCKATFSPGLTTVNFLDLKNAIKSYGYNASLIQFDDTKVKSNVASYRPVICANNLVSSIGEMGHAWIVSGTSSTYSTTYYELWGCPDKYKFRQITYTAKHATYGPSYYINWGWGGSYDGYYSRLDNVVPNSSYTSGKTSLAIVDIYPK